MKVLTMSTETTPLRSTITMNEEIQTATEDYNNTVKAINEQASIELQNAFKAHELEILRISKKYKEVE